MGTPNVKRELHIVVTDPATNTVVMDVTTQAYIVAAMIRETSPSVVSYIHSGYPSDFHILAGNIYTNIKPFLAKPFGEI